MRAVIRSLVGASVSLTLAAALVACGGSGKSGSGGASDTSWADGLSPTSPNLIYAVGWTDFDMIANFAKTKIDNAGHFTTSRNACGKDAWGAWGDDVKGWNAFVTAANESIKTEPLREDQCFAPADNNKMDGNVEIILVTGRRTVLEARGGQICTNIRDLAVAKAVYAGIDNLVHIADKEDCPNGFGH